MLPQQAQFLAGEGLAHVLADLDLAAMLIGVRTPGLHGGSRSAMEVGGKVFVHLGSFSSIGCGPDHRLRLQPTD
jgi:hypothetical protein